VEAEIRKVAPRSSSVSVYGGVAYWQQEQALRRGVDFLCATPGRLMDLLE
jgi:superfamily II DNA/RNA helicase